MRGPRFAVLLALAWAACAAAGGLSLSAPPRLEGAHGLWRKAIELHQRNRDWYPERVVILSEVLTRRGQPSSLTEMVFRLRLDARGRVQAELERAQKNGEDTTARTRAKVTIRSPEEGLDPEDDTAYSVSLTDSPFAAARQGAVQAFATAEHRTLFGRLCRRFNFSYRTAIVRKGKAEELTWRGMAWLDEASGMPVKLEFTFSPLPGLVRSLWSIYLYDIESPERWVLKQVSMTGHGGFLFIRKNFRTTTTFGQYRRASAASRPGPAAAGRP
jgi:hypothetical protein